MHLVIIAALPPLLLAGVYGGLLLMGRAADCAHRFGWEDFPAFGWMTGWTSPGAIRRRYEVEWKPRLGAEDAAQMERCLLHLRIWSLSWLAVFLAGFLLALRVD